jgi:predicted nucleic acid-binding protein
VSAIVADASPLINLARAKREGRIDNLKRHLDLLIERGTWIDAGLYAEVLRLMGE